MARLTDFGHGRVDAPRLDPRDIIVRGDWNFRDMSSAAVREHVAHLKESIRTRGVEQPITVEMIDGKIYLVNGECRLRALRELWEAGDEVFVLSIQAKGSEDEILAKSMIANGGLPPTQLEFGKAAERLQAFGWSVDRIAALTPPHLGLQGGKAKRYVRDAVDLQQAPLAVKKAVSEGIDGVTVSPALALSVTKQNRMEAPAIIEKAAAEAKAAGKKTATRPKGAGPVTKAKAAREVKVQTIEAVGDNIADLILNEAPDWEVLEKLAAQWNKLRGR